MFVGTLITLLLLLLQQVCDCQAFHSHLQQLQQQQQLGVVVIDNNNNNGKNEGHSMNENDDNNCNNNKFLKNSTDTGRIAARTNNRTKSTSSSTLQHYNIVQQEHSNHEDDVVVVGLEDYLIRDTDGIRSNAVEVGDLAFDLHHCDDITKENSILIVGVREVLQRQHRRVNGSNVRCTDGGIVVRRTNADDDNNNNNNNHPNRSSSNDSNNDKSKQHLPHKNQRKDNNSDDDRFAEIDELTETLAMAVENIHNGDTTGSTSTTYTNTIRRKGTMTQSTKVKPPLLLLPPLNFRKATTTTRM